MIAALGLLLATAVNPLDVECYRLEDRDQAVQGSAILSETGDYAFVFGRSGRVIASLKWEEFGDVMARVRWTPIRVACPGVDPGRR